MIKFVTVDASGRKGPIREISQEDILKCPHVILMMEHYRADNSCRCNDPTHLKMIEWGYVWDGGKWISKENDDV